ncbi:hypothetical protein K3495_g11922 [Podosphaera aphanis]|nr:hypothetical protein K3495_g11922 [Podosphaera aphanis]
MVSMRQDLQVMQDNAPSHKAAQTMRELNETKITPIEWPSYSPDLNPIENVWNMMKSYIQFKYPDLGEGRQRSQDELRDIVKESWDWAVDENDLERLIESMPRRIRYLSPSVIHMRIQQRQTLKQNAKTVQQYKQRFEFMCKETSFPRQVWGEEFFKGLIDPLQGKLLGTPHIDITNYDVVTQLALQFESGYQMQKELKSFDTQVGNKSKAFSMATSEPKKPFPLP